MTLEINMMKKQEEGGWTTDVSSISHASYNDDWFFQHAGGDQDDGSFSFSESSASFSTFAAEPEEHEFKMPPSYQQDDDKVARYMQGMMDWWFSQENKSGVSDKGDDSLSGYADEPLRQQYETPCQRAKRTQTYMQDMMKWWMHQNSSDGDIDVPVSIASRRAPEKIVHSATTTTRAAKQEPPMIKMWKQKKIVPGFYGLVMYNDSIKSLEKEWSQKEQDDKEAFGECESHRHTPTCSTRADDMDKKEELEEEEHKEESVQQPSHFLWGSQDVPEDVTSSFSSFSFQDIGRFEDEPSYEHEGRGQPSFDPFYFEEERCCSSLYFGQEHSFLSMSELSMGGISSKHAAKLTNTRRQRTGTRVLRKRLGLAMKKLNCARTTTSDDKGNSGGGQATAGTPSLS